MGKTGLPPAVSPWGDFSSPAAAASCAWMPTVAKSGRRACPRKQPASPFSSSTAATRLLP